jgi:hypothetical protein
MILANTAATNDQYMASLLFKEDDSTERPQQDRRASLRHLHGFRHRAAQEDSSSEEGIQGQKLLESITDTFQPEDSVEIYRLSLMGSHVIATINWDSIPAVVSPNPPKAFAVQLEGGGALQPSFRSAEFPITNIGCEHTELNAMQYSQKRRMLRQSAGMVHWGDISPFPSLPVITEPLTVNTEPGIDKDVIWTEILERFDVIAQREDNWDGLESLKPNEISLDKAKHIMEKLLDTVISKEYSWGESPYVCSDENGYITVEWYGNERELHLRIEEREVEYIEIESIDTEMRAHVDTISGDDCFALWKWLINEQ